MTLKLEVGKWYKDGYGTIQGPMKENIHSLVYKFISPNETYTAKGAYDIELMSKYDLITECNADGSPIEPPAPAIDPQRYALLDDVAKAVKKFCAENVISKYYRGAVLWRKCHKRFSGQAPTSQGGVR